MSVGVGEGFMSYLHRAYKLSVLFEPEGGEAMNYWGRLLWVIC